VALLVRFRISVAIVALALAATAGVFLFARPEYRSPGGSTKALHFAEAQPPAQGWTWTNGTPGFHFGDHHDAWNISELKPRELAALEVAARREGVDPASLGVLASLRTYPRGSRPEVLAAGADARGRTCVGVQLHRGPASFLCPARLQRTLAVVVADAMPVYRSSRSAHTYSMFVTGVARAEVTRVTVLARGETTTDMRSGKPVVRPAAPQLAYDRATPSWWGVLELSTGQPVPWDATVVFYGTHGRLGSLRIRLAHAGERLFAVPY
jgi:hypothetical protein